jgi:hypothetical protein
MGICLPLLVTTRSATILEAWPFSIPLAAAASMAAGRLLTCLLVRVGLSSDEARRRMVHIALPFWIVGFAPLALMLPVSSLPHFLILAAAAISIYRLVSLARELLGAARLPLLETAIFGALFCAGLLLLFRVQIVHDALQYYGYLVSVALDGDLNLYDQIYLHNAERFYNPFPKESARYIGTAIMEVPWLGMAHLATMLLGSAVRNGYSLPYGLFVTLASALFGLAGLVITYRLCAEFFPRRESMAATIATAFASPLVFFMYTWGGWAHPFAFFFVAAFIQLWQRTRGERTLQQWALLGLLAGAIALIRPTAALVLLLPLLEWIGRLKQDAGRQRSLIGGPAVAALAAFVLFSPQLSIWKALSGSWIATPYNEVGDFHDWLNPAFGGMLFSAARHGLFAWTPLLLAAAAGLFLLLRRDRLLGAGALLITGGTFYLYACWSIWWTGIGFSNRFFIELTPLFVLGLAALLQSMRRWLTRDRLCGLLAVAIAWNLMLIGAYRANDIPQGIPDPHRVVDAPLTRAGLASTALDSGGAAWIDWIHDGFFTGRAAKALTFHDAGALLALLALAAAVMLAAMLLIRLLLARRFLSGTMRGSLICIGLAAASVLLVHGAIWSAAGSGGRIGRFHHLPETDLHLRQPAADTWIYCDHPLPVSHVDLLTQLNYGHPVAQGEVVAEVTIHDDHGRSFSKLLQAGIDTAEASYLRPEYRDSIRHGIEQTEIVRSRPSGVYSARSYEMLVFRSVLELPEPVVVKSIRLRYLNPAGRLIVSDIFLRSFP